MAQLVLVEGLRGHGCGSGAGTEREFVEARLGLQEVCVWTGGYEGDCMQRWGQ